MFTDENGNLSAIHFIIPHGELFGKWIITAENGLNSENFKFQASTVIDF